MRVVEWVLICLMVGGSVGCTATQEPELPQATKEAPCTLPADVSPYSLEALAYQKECQGK